MSWSCGASRWDSAGAVRRLLAGVLSPGRLVRHVAAGLSEQSISWDFVGLIEPRSSQIRLKVHQQLARMHPADLADILEDLGRVERRASSYSEMDPGTAAQALSEAEPSVQATMVEAMHTEKAADLLEEMQPDEAADILGELPESRSRERCSRRWKTTRPRTCGELLFLRRGHGGRPDDDGVLQGPGGSWTVGERCSRPNSGEIDDDPPRSWTKSRS